VKLGTVDVKIILQPTTSIIDKWCPVVMLPLQKFRKWARCVKITVAGIIRHWRH